MEKKENEKRSLVYKKGNTAFPSTLENDTAFVIE